MFFSASPSFSHKEIAHRIHCASNEGRVSDNLHKRHSLSALRAAFGFPVLNAPEYSCVAHDFVVMGRHRRLRMIGVCAVFKRKSSSLSFQNFNVRCGVKGRALGTHLKYPKFANDRASLTVRIYPQLPRLIHVQKMRHHVIFRYRHPNVVQILVMMMCQPLLWRTLTWGHCIHEVCYR